MKRRHRKNYNDPGHAHELTFSCYRRQPLLEIDFVRRRLVAAIDEARREWQFDLWAYVVMPEHVHLIVHPRLPDYDIARIRKAIKAPVGREAIKHFEDHAPHWIPRLTRTRGGKSERLFWQSGGGYDRNITEPSTLMKMIEYLHLNPVRRGLVEQAQDWELSSAGSFIDGRVGLLRVDPIPPDWCV